MKNFVVSDIHDNYDLLMDALARNGFDINDSSHRLIVCGDAFFSGPKPAETFVFLREMSEKGRLIFIYGNHDIDILDSLRAKNFRRAGNRTCAELIVEHLTQKTGLTDDELVSECEKIGFIRFLAETPVWYYENEDYVFTHAFIPTENNAYRADWRNATEEEWRKASTSDAMLLSMYYGISEPNKKIICGHFGAARCHLMKNATQEDWDNQIYKGITISPIDGYKPFFGDTFIAIDSSVNKTGVLSCIVV